MAKKEIDANDVLIGTRLSYIIARYFVSIKAFSDKTGIASATISRYIKGTLKISLKAMKTLENKGEINPNFLQFGEMPELNTDRKPINDNIGELEQNKKQKQRESDNLRDKNMLPYSAMTRQGINSKLISQDEQSIIRLAINGLEDPEVIRITDEEFIKTYKDLYELIKMNCIFVISKTVEDGDVIIIKSDREHRIVILERGKYYDKLTGEEIFNVANSNIVGKLYGIYVVI